MALSTNPPGTVPSLGPQGVSPTGLIHQIDIAKNLEVKQDARVCHAIRDKLLHATIQ
jgi:hypothetical protein